MEVLKICSTVYSGDQPLTPFSDPCSTADTAASQHILSSKPNADAGTLSFRVFQEANQSGHMSWTLFTISSIMRRAQVWQELGPNLILIANHLNLAHSYHLPRSGVVSSGTQWVGRYQASSH